jgi:GWxTD domain-containing protein
MKRLTENISFNSFARLILVVGSLLCFSLNTLAGLNAYLTYSTFSSPKTGPYIETYLTVVGQTIHYKKNTKGKFQGTVEVTLLFKQNDSIKAIQKYNLNSQEVDDSLKGRTNFTDQQRFALSNGAYDFEIQIADKNATAAPYKWNEKISIDYPADKAVVSDIEFLESYTKSTTQSVLTKSGYDLLPYVSNFYPDNFNKLSFYCEIYNIKQQLGENERFVINYYIQSAETYARMNDFGSFSTQTVAPVNVLLTSFMINSLPSGNYYLVIDVRDKSNKALAVKKKLFQRKNTKVRLSMEDLTAVNTLNSFVASITNKDSLIDDIKSLRPTATDAEKNFIDENANKVTSFELLQQFFLNFWKTRNETKPESEWKKYYADVKKVNKEFGCINMKGYDTDRGRVYLQYGVPYNMITNQSDNGSYPYEMWQYAKLKTQTNRVFIFYNPDFVSCNYKLLHSDARGELSNLQWQSIIHEGNVDSNVPTNDDEWGRHTNQNYLNSK